ncbi:unnamed protein product [Discosporangium mesarthrocarpum]
MKARFRLDLKRRETFKKYESQRAALKSLLFSQAVDYDTRWWAQLALNKQPRDGSISRVRNRCIQTLRGRSVQSHYKLSRLRLRRLISRGLFPGIRKASW